MTVFNLSTHQQAVVDRFVAAGREDDRVLAAFLGGSFARGTADGYSDLDLYLITTDEDFEDFCARVDDFLLLLGKPLFAENFDIPHFIFFILADGTEGELGIGRESRFTDIHGGPYRVLVDKKGILAGVEFPEAAADPDDQREVLRRLVVWFWHDLSHFITATGRGQWWWAQGQLEVLRRVCVNLARLNHHFSDGEVGEEAYFKLDKALPVEQLAALEATYCARNWEELVSAGFALVRFYKQLAVPLAETVGILYPEELEKIIMPRMESLAQATPSMRERFPEVEPASS